MRYAVDAFARQGGVGGALARNLIGRAPAVGAGVGQGGDDDRVVVREEAEVGGAIHDRHRQRFGGGLARYRALPDVTGDRAWQRLPAGPAGAAIVAAAPLNRAGSRALGRHVEGVASADQRGGGAVGTAVEGVPAAPGLDQIGLDEIAVLRFVDPGQQ